MSISFFWHGFFILKSCFEYRSLQTTLTHQIAPETFPRYVYHNQESFLKVLHDQYPQIQYTIKYDSNKNKLSFLKLTVINSQTNKYKFKVYKYPAITKCINQTKLKYLLDCYHWRFQSIPFTSFQGIFTKVFRWRNHISDWHFC